MKTAFARGILFSGLTILAAVQAWAAENSAPELKPKQGLKPLEYMESAAPLPNYRANAQWGTQDEPIRTMQKPLSAAESAQHLVTFPEFTTSLFASEPNVVKAIWMNWDERGRLWIASTTDYPNNMQPEGKGNDRLIICEDTNGDGKADKFKTFADKLSVPTSFVFANDGVIVVHSGKTEFLQDTNGDDQADVRRDLFRGWGTQDTHAGPSNLRYGFDHWIWGVVGYSGFRGTVGGKELRFGQGIFRFKPDGSALEFVRSSNNNTWGLAFTEDNIVIGSTANGNASMYLPIANRYYEKVNGFSPSVLGTIADSQQFYPITKQVLQVDYHGKFTAGAGSAIYTARNFPKEYWNRAQFVCEPTGHLLARFNLEGKGADFVAHNARNFAASDDAWTSPVCAEVGPDGALWVSDWYNYIIQHNPTPRGFSNGRGNAYETPLRDTVHGRIYRIAYREAKPPQTTALSKQNPAQLIAALNDDNMFWRMTAQRLLIERGQKDVVPELVKLIGDNRPDALELFPGAIHALWTLRGLNAGTEASERALPHRSAAVRRAAVMTLASSDSAAKRILEAGVLSDPNAQVRLAALLALSESEPSEQAARAIFAMLRDAANAKDRWIPDAAIAAASRNDAEFLKVALASRQEAFGDAQRVVRIVTSHYAQRGPSDTIASTLLALNGAPAEAAATILDGLVAGWPSEKAPMLAAAEKQKLSSLMEALAEPVRDRLLALSVKWNQPDLFGGNLAAILESLKAQVADGDAADEKRASAAKRLMGIDGRSDVAKFVLQQVSTLSAPALVSGYLSAMNESRDSSIGSVIVGNWKSFSPAGRRAAVQTLSRRPEWTRQLLESVEDGKITRGDIAVEQWSQLKSNPDRQIARRAERLAQAGTAISTDREEVVKKFLPIAKEKGDAARGKEIFATACAVCHVFDGQGGKVGPDLTGVGAKDRAEVLTDILDPNRSVEANYRLWNLTTKEGDTFSGRLEAETQTTVELLDTTSQRHVVQRKDIKSLEGLTISIMPTGFESIAENDMKALLTYLSTPH